MKALAVLQPSAQLLILGAKCFETRSWKTKHRGPLLIHAGRTFSDKARECSAAEPIRGILKRAGIRSPTDLPRGVLLGTITLDDCVPTDEVTYATVDEREFAFGDFRPGHWAWKVSNPIALAVPIPYHGVLGIFDVPDEVLGFSPVGLSHGCLSWQP
jgi:hypothetical protein